MKNNNTIVDIQAWQQIGNGLFSKNFINIMGIWWNINGRRTTQQYNRYLLMLKWEELLEQEKKCTVVTEKCNECALSVLPSSTVQKKMIRKQWNQRRSTMRFWKHTNKKRQEISLTQINKWGFTHKQNSRSKKQINES